MPGLAHVGIDVCAVSHGRSVIFQIALVVVPACGNGAARRALYLAAQLLVLARLSLRLGAWLLHNPSVAYTQYAAGSLGGSRPNWT
jgi:hypothetical protein